MHVDVIMVAHNAGEFLDGAMRSILEQSHRELSLIVVDNASTDGSIVAARRALKDDRIVWCRSADNVGPYAGFEIGFAKSDGPFVARMDADDISLPDRIALQLACLQAAPNLEAVGGCATTIDESGRPLGGHLPAWGLADELHIRSVREMPVVHPTLFARRAVFEASGYRVPFTLAADFDLVARLADRRAIANVPVEVLKYRRHAFGVSASRRRLQAAMAGAVRLATARRRSGRDECIEDLTAFATRTADETNDVSSVFSALARRCARDGALRLAAWHAERALALAATEEGASMWARGAADGSRALKHRVRRLLDGKTR